MLTGKLQGLLAVLMIYSDNMRVLHWKCCGVDFEPYHELTANYYSKLNDITDEIAEMGMQLGTNPITVLDAKDIITSIDENVLALSAIETYPNTKVLEHIDYMYKHLMTMTTVLRNTDGMPEYLKSELDTIIAYFSKEVLYKNTKRLLKG